MSKTCIAALVRCVELLGDCNQNESFFQILLLYYKTNNVLRKYEKVIHSEITKFNNFLFDKFVFLW